MALHDLITPCMIVTSRLSLPRLVLYWTIISRRLLSISLCWSCWSFFVKLIIIWVLDVNMRKCWIKVAFAALGYLQLHLFVILLSLACVFKGKKCQVFPVQCWFISYCWQTKCTVNVMYPNMIVKSVSCKTRFQLEEKDVEYEEDACTFFWYHAIVSQYVSIIKARCHLLKLNDTFE